MKKKSKISSGSEPVSPAAKCIFGVAQIDRVVRMCVCVWLESPKRREHLIGLRDCAQKN